MIKKKGFTLVELLSVIAILTILVLIALPNIVGFFTSSKMNSFKNELQSAYSASEEKWVKDHITHRGEIVYARTASNNCELSLDLSGRQTFNYYIKMNNKGKIIEYYAEDGIYQYMYTGDGLEKEDITEVVEMSKININDRINFTCDGKVEQSEPTVTLTVNPNGGTWNGSSSSQTFNQKAGTTKTISNPTSKSIQISYNDNGQGATFDSTPQTDQAPFNKWNIGGVGTLNGTTYTFGSSNGTLTAEYSPTSITLKTITKNGYTCKWAENSPAGSQVSSGDNISTSTSMTFYAVCTPGGGSQEYTLIVDANGGTWNGAPIYAFHSTMVGVTQSLTPDPTKTITITYDENGQGATFSNTTQSVQATFNKWTLSGAGTLSGTTYTFEAGDGTVTASYNESEYVLQSITKNGYICKWAEGSASGTQYTGGTSRTITENKTYYAVCTANSYILTVKPNGGTWDGKTTSQDFTQNYGTTKTIANPTVGSTYSISYNMNGTGITKPTSPVSVQRPFTSWTKDGGGTLNGTTYTFGSSNGTLTANYNTTSSSFLLPAISKSGYTCKWAEGSASGTQYTGGASRTITGNKTYYAVCTANSYILTVKPNGGTWGGKTTNQTFTQACGSTKTIANPTAGPTYSISYNMNGTGITAPTSPVSVQRPFSSWTKDGEGTLSGATYTFGAGAGSLTANYNTTSSSFTLPSISKNGYTCKWAEGSTSGTQYTGGTPRTITGNKTYYAVCTANSYKLTVNPNGGTWGGKTTNQDFTQAYGTTKTIANPTVGPTYSITYDMNGTGITKPTSPVSVQRPFSSWTNAGSGSISGATYTFGAGNGTLTANYNTTSSSFTLPSISKSGYTCKWAEGSASGTQYTGGTSRTITGNKTYYAVCTINSYKLTVNPNGGTWGGKTTSQEFTQNYGTTKTIANPTGGPTYSISYNMNGTGITAPTSPVSVQRPFTSWTNSGSGSISGTTYTFGAGDGTLTANYNTTSSSFTLPSISKNGYTCKWAEGSASGTQYTGGASRTITGNKTYYAVCTINSYKLTVNPNGGTWGGKTTSQEFTQNYGTTKTIANPTAGPTYSISYNMNGTGITKPTSPVSVQRPFDSWTRSGSGSISGTTYTFGAGDGTLTANYNTTSSSFTLPSISKSGYTCKWAEGSTSGTQYTGGASRTITGNKTYYAVCTANSYILTVKPNGGTWGGKTTNQDFTQNYGTTKTIANPTAGPTYSITYDMNGTGVTKPTSPVSVQRPFDSWIAGGSGSISGTTYTFGAGAGTLTAIYKTASNKFTLPALSKDNFTCNWLEDSTSGTQYAPGAQLSISSNKTYYAKCVENCKWLCPTGYSGDGSGGCVQTKDATKTPYCPTGSKDMDASGLNFGTYSYYDCYNTSSFTGGTCVGKPYTAYGDNNKYCFSYYSYSYSCDSGWTLSGTSCYRTASKECRVSECTWKCPTGYTANSSGMCEKTTTANSQGVCPSGSKDMVASGLNFGNYSYYDCYQHWSFPGSTYAGTPYTGYGDNNKYYFSYYESYSYTCPYGGVLNGQTCKFTVEKDCN